NRSPFGESEFFSEGLATRSAERTFAYPQMNYSDGSTRIPSRCPLPPDRSDDRLYVLMDAKTISDSGHGEPKVPVLAPILRLHRHGDGYVTFSAGGSEEFHYRVAIRGDELQTYFAEFVDACSKDYYVSINAGYRLSRFGRNGRAFGYPKHDSVTLRYLCAC